MNYVPTEIAQYLEDNDIGTQGVDIFVDKLPASPVSVISVMGTGGVEPDIDLPNSSPKFEVLVRGLTHEGTYQKIKDVVDLLHQKFNVELVSGGNYYYSILLMGEINFLGRDENSNLEFSANLKCKVRGR